jgi:hypothetical protein
MQINRTDCRRAPIAAVAIAAAAIAAAPNAIPEPSQSIGLKALV